MTELDFAVGEIRFRARFSDDHLVSRFCRIMTYFGADRVPARDRPSISLEVAALNRWPIPENATLLGRERELGIYEHAGTVYIDAASSVSQVELSNRRGIIYLSGEDDSDSVRGCDLHAATIAVLALLRPAGRFGLHGACLVKEGRGWLFIGESDSGKSTLAYTLLRAGWQYITDDSMLIAAIDSGVTVWPLRRDFCLDPDAADLFPEIRHSWRAQFTDADKRIIEVDRIFEARRADSARACYLVFPKLVTDAQSSISSISKTDALLRLLRQSALLGIEPRHASDQMNTLKRLVESSRCFELCAAPDIKGNPSAADELLSVNIPDALCRK